MPRILSAIIIVLVIGLVCRTANAEDAGSNSNWDFSLAPMYLWAVSIDGDQTVKGVDVDLDVPFRLRIQCRGGFIQNQDGRILQ